MVDGTFGATEDGAEVVADTAGVGPGLLTKTEVPEAGILPDTGGAGAGMLLGAGPLDCCS